MPLHEIKTTYKKAKRVGRGGKRGKTAGRGHKGQKARAGGTPRPAYRDVIKKMPKLRGHGINRARTVNDNARKPYAITIALIENNFKAGETVSLETLLEKGLISKKTPVKIISRGELTKKLTFKDVLVTAGAQAQITEAGGAVADSK